MTFYFDRKFIMINLRKFWKFREIYGKYGEIYGKYREEMWEKKKINVGEFLSILCAPSVHPRVQLRITAIYSTYCMVECS